jgi:hypothetical protein
MLDIHGNFEVKRLISPLTQTNSDTAIVSQIIDLANYDGCEILLAIGGLTDADATFAQTFEHSDDSGMSGAVAVPAADLIGAPAAFTFAADDTVQQWGYRGNKRYIRLTITPTNNNSGAAPLGAVVLLRKKKVGSTL